MKKALLLSAFVLAFSSAQAQQAADPALDALNQDNSGAPPSELDALSRGASTDFPDIEKKQQRKPVSVTLRALNKITAKYTDVSIKMNETARFGSLEITPRYCDKRPPEEFPETTAFIEIADKTPKRPPNLKSAEKAAADAAAATDAAAEAAAPAPVAGQLSDAERARALDDILTDEQKQKALGPDVIFSGWMFASSPALNGLDHPVYDVWVIDCKTVAVDN